MSDTEDRQMTLDLPENNETASLPLAAELDEAFLPVLNKDDEVLVLDDGFDFDGFQVVRREFFAHLSEPSVTFNNCKFYVNSACLSKFPKVDFVQVLVNRESKILALRPCREHERDSFLWCCLSKGKRKPKQITCKLFYAKIVSLMGWNPHYRYKMLGKLIHANGEYLIAFDLTATEVYERTFAEGEKPKTSRTPVVPADWQNQFGMPFEEHKHSMQISTFDGYAIYAIKDKNGNAKKAASGVGFEQIKMKEV